ncbi:surface antigen BspA-like [Glaciecola sp. KUL10]|nr:surface antigen BspA-like [Glaciecola sp. KUL10]
MQSKTATTQSVKLARLLSKSKIYVTFLLKTTRFYRCTNLKLLFLFSYIKTKESIFINNNTSLTKVMLPKTQYCM